MTGPKRITSHGNFSGRAYDIRILEAWLSFDRAGIVNSFNYCGIVTQYIHSGLKDWLKSEIIPPNVSIELKTEEDDPNFADIFVNYVFEDVGDFLDDDYREISDNSSASSKKSSLSDGSTISSDVEPESDHGTLYGTDSDSEEPTQKHLLSSRNTFYRNIKSNSFFY